MDWFKFDPVDFLHGTRHLTKSERGVYITIICHMWDKGPMTKDQIKQECGRIAAISLQHVLNKFSILEQSCNNVVTILYFSKRLEKERVSAGDKSEKVKYVKWLDSEQTVDKSVDKSGGTEVAPKKKSDIRYQKSDNKKETIAKKVTPSKKLFTHMPTDFSLSQPMLEFAQKKGVADVEAEFEGFVSWAEQGGIRMKNWEAAWRTRCINYAKWKAEKQQNGGKNQKTTLDAANRVIKMLKLDEG